MLLPLVLLVASASSAEVARSLPAYRLPEDIIPHLYKLSVLTDLNEFSFSGFVDIQVVCRNSTNVIKLHSKSLDIPTKEISVKREKDKSAVRISAVQLEPKNDYLIINVSQALKSGEEYILHIDFSGKLSQSLEGYYRSSYWDKTTKTTKWLAVTQLAAIFARQAFPCFDEPAFKAKFHVRLGHRPGLQAISNMPIYSSYMEDGWVWDEFDESVPMSTYLVAYMICDFDYVESDVEANNVQFNVWARKDVIEQTQFARKYGPKFLVFYEDFFGINFPLPKQDMVAVPDFSAGAMENWGLITYREAQFLVDEKTTSTAAFYSIAGTLAHELAHQWFGNLVTMKWWTDLWLNEGFATFISSIAIRKTFPKWNSYTYDVVTCLLSTFALDSLKSSHPVSVPIGHPNEVNQIFDAITYKKGGFLLHMMSTFLGEEVLRSGLSKYLKKFSYGNSEQDDLWESLTEEAQHARVLPDGVTVKDIMDTWTLQPGFPVLNIVRDRGNLTITQKRFLAIQPRSREDQCWWIPIHYTTANSYPVDASQLEWMSCESPEMHLDTEAGPNDWIILNNKISGLYRVNYDMHSWSLLADALNSEKMTTIDELSRFQLVADSMALAHVNEMDYTMAIRILKYIKNERAYTPWRAATIALGQLENVLWRTKKYKEFKAFVRYLLTDIQKEFTDLRHERETIEELRHQALITSWACKFEVGNCAENAFKLFQQWAKSGKNIIPKDLRYIVYCEGVRQGGEKESTFIWRKYLESNVPNEKNMYLGTLGCSRNQEFLYRLLEWTMDPDSGVRSQDVRLVYSSVSGTSQLGFKVTKKFLELNVKKIHDYFLSSQVASYIIKMLSEKMVTTKEVNQMKEFIENNEDYLDMSHYSIRQGLESAESNVAWIRTFYKNISTALTV